MPRVLIVDDEEELLLGLSAFLSRGGWEVLTATNVEEAMAILKSQPVDVIVTDIRMPGDSGLTLLQHIKSERKDMRAVVITAKGSPEMEREVVSLGADAYLEKPFDLDYFVRVLKKVMTSKGFKGVVQELTLIDVLQLLAYESGTALVEVSSPEGMGRIWIKDGKVVHAEIGDITGIQAFERILSLEGGTFAVKRGVETEKQTISESLDSLLLRTISASEETGVQESEQNIEEWSLLSSFQIEEVSEEVKKRADEILERLKGIGWVKGAAIFIDGYFTGTENVYINEATCKSAKSLLNHLNRRELFVPGNPDYYFYLLEDVLICLEAEGIPLAILKVELKKLL
jgi:Response regulator containing CheY-like receiver, AAA-type ATPase, and DNA-binding domains